MEFKINLKLVSALPDERSGGSRVSSVIGRWRLEWMLLPGIDNIRPYPQKNNQQSGKGVRIMRTKIK